MYAALTAQGYQATSSVVSYQPNWVPHQVKEVVINGPDNVALCHFARMTDEADAYSRQYIKFNHSAQMVPDLDEVSRFYGDILGLDLNGRMTIPPGMVEDILHLPEDTRTDVSFYVKHGMDGIQMEFLEMHVDVRSQRETARPPDLGLFMLAFEVDDLDTVAASASKAGFRLMSGPVSLERKLYGSLRATTVLAPGGVMVELFQRVLG